MSAQAYEGEIITIEITYPDNAKKNLATNTLADGTYSIVEMFTPGEYIVQTSIQSDGRYKTVKSPIVHFTVPSE